MKRLVLVLSAICLALVAIVATRAILSDAGGAESAGPVPSGPSLRTSPGAKSFCTYGRWTLTVEGDVSCSAARRVMRAEARRGGAPSPWLCGGPDAHISCYGGVPGTVITARF
jgi:hypothetical protein